MVAIRNNDWTRQDAVAMNLKDLPVEVLELM
jgi:hypothetical protein